MKKTLLIILIVLIGIQFIRPDENREVQPTKNEITSVLKVPLEIQEIIKTSCYDCHSNNTAYPWYQKMAPISWIIANHVNEGKEHLNFSEWNQYNFNQKKHLLDEIEEVIAQNKMPLKSYLLMHNEVKLTQQEREWLLEWIALEKISNTTR